MLKTIKNSIGIQIIISMMIGILVGMYLGKSAGPLGELGKVVITLIKAAAAPLLFFVIVHSLMISSIERKQGFKLLRIIIINTTFALVIGIGISKIFQPGKSLSMIQDMVEMPSQFKAFADKKIDFMESFKSYIPESFFKPFLDNAVLSLVLVALMFGFSLRGLKKSLKENEIHYFDQLEWFFGLMAKMFETILKWLVHLTPLAVFGVVAKTIGEYGFEPLKGLSIYVLVGLLGLAIHVLVVYQSWIYFSGISLKEFWSKAKSTLIYSIGVNSSLATLPLTLKSLHELKVSKDASTLGACVATNFNNDGILLYEGMAVFFVSQAMGLDLTFSQHLLAAFACIVGTLGVAGVPEAGFVTLALVLSTVGIPTEILPMILTVDWILGRARTFTNVVGDMAVSIALDEKRKS